MDRERDTSKILGPNIDLRGEGGRSRREKSKLSFGHSWAHAQLTQGKIIHHSCCTATREQVYTMLIRRGMSPTLLQVTTAVPYQRARAMCNYAYIYSSCSSATCQHIQKHAQACLSYCHHAGRCSKHTVPRSRVITAPIRLALRDKVSKA